MLPEGGSRQDLKNPREFRKHALQHGLEWYRHAKDVRGRMCPDGSLYLVTGHDKTRSWGLTSFVSGAVSVKLGVANTSRWEYSGAVFHCSDDAQPPINENQCVFLRGFMISVCELSERRRTGKKVHVQDIKELGRESLQGTNPSGPTCGRDTGGRSQGLQQSGSSVNGNGQDGSESAHTTEGCNDENKETNNGEGDPETHHTVILRSIPGLSKVCHYKSVNHDNDIHLSSFAIRQLL